MKPLGPQLVALKTFVRDSAAPVADALCVLVSAIGAAIVTYHGTREIGFADVAHRAAVLPFNLTAPTNSLFQYAACCATLLVVGAVYGRACLPRLGAAARGVDFLAAGVSLPLLWTASSPRAALALFTARAAVTAGLALTRLGRALDRPAVSRLIARLTSMAALALLLGAGSVLLPAGLWAAVSRAPGWLIAIGLAPAVVFALEQTLPAPALLWERRVVSALVLCAIPAITFNIGAAAFDFSIVVGPINDILRGKDILSNVVSTYGFLSNYFLAAGFWLFGVRDLYVGLSVVDSMAYSVGYASIFLFLVHRIRSVALCLAFMVALVALHYFHLHVPIFWLPQAGFLRFGTFLPVFYLIYLLDHRPGSRALEWWPAVVVPLCVFWTVEVGGYIAVAAVATFGHWMLFRQPSGLRGWAIVGKTALSTGVFLALACGWVLARHGHWPIWAGLVHFQRAYSAGLAMQRLNSFERWPLPILVYWTTLYLAFRYSRGMRHVHAWVFLSVFGLASMAYPIGKGGIYDLARVILPAMLLVASAAGALLDSRGALAGQAASRNLGLERAVFGTVMLFSLATACVVYADVSAGRKETRELEESGANPIAHRAPAWQAFFFAAPARQTQFQADLEAIRTLVPPEEALPLLSRNDTLYYAYGQRASLYRNSFYPHFFLKSDIDEIVSALRSSRVPYLFVENSSFQPYVNQVDPAPMTSVIARVRAEYVFDRHAGFLDVYRRRAGP